MSKHFPTIIASIMLIAMLGLMSNCQVDTNVPLEYQSPMETSEHLDENDKEMKIVTFLRLNFIDSYNNITLKAMHTLKFFLNKGNFLPSASKDVIRPFNIKCYSWLYDSFFFFFYMFTSPAPEYLF